MKNEHSAALLSRKSCTSVAPVGQGKLHNGAGGGKRVVWYASIS